MRKTMPLLAAVGVVALVACGSSPTATGSPAPSTSSAPASAATPSANATPTTLDPCQLVTSQEASALAGASYGPGREETNSGGGGTSKSCYYGYQTLNVFSILVTQAPDAATASAAWAQEESQAQLLLTKAAGHGVTISFKLDDVSSLSGADKAAAGTFSKAISGTIFSASAIYVLKGATFFTFANLTVGHAAPSTSAMEAEAQTVLGRIP